MKRYRFIDPQGEVACGHEPADDHTLRLLLGEPFAGLRDGRRRVTVPQLLALLEPRAIPCLGVPTSTLTNPVAAA